MLKMAVQKQIVVITGGPGFGKTELISELERLGFPCSGEFARDLIFQQQKISGEILPWKNSGLFQREVLRQRIAFFESVSEHTLAFSDRGIPDQIAFSRYRGFGSPPILLESAQNYRYYQKVFSTPPWFEIFRNDEIRTETYEEAVKIHEVVKNTYLDLDYEVVDLPLGTVKERIEFILKSL